jgi:hypothetical protein
MWEARELAVKAMLEEILPILLLEELAEVEAVPVKLDSMELQV